MSLYFGIVGMLFILAAFILDEFFKTWRQNSIKYNLLNIIGSGLLAYYAFTISSWPFIILNVAWFIAAGYKLVVLLKK
ncbi:hypothetical protein HY495_03705 [Candidatus Woesearchaeota archaeon]|nr:hypothetical protein [Candidatus Woesearchaeota archaeon]